MKTYKVKLRLFQDDDNGEWGLAHDNAIDINTPFNAFWSHQGIFHDVFEHYFEDNNYHFLGDASFNIGGEVAAMGHLSYYWSHYSLDERRLNRGSIWSMEQSIMQTTMTDMVEAISSGYCYFGSELVCTVPYQKPGDGTLENIIESHWESIKDKKFRRNSYFDEREYREAETFRKSITKSKIQRLYRWGYHQASKIAPWSSENYDTLVGFLNFWETFVTRYRAEELAEIFRSIEFTIRGGEKLRWDAEWITHEGQRVRGNTLYPEELLLDLYAQQEINY